MARSRNIKPGFFSNEHLAELDFATRLLFIGMWTEADREGRLEDRPRRLKMALFPADNVDINRMLDDLDHLGFIKRYTVGDVKAIQVINWAKHQNPHVKEAKSTIPEMPGLEGSQAEPGASTVQAPDSHGSFPADSLSLDSGFRIPDSLTTSSSAPDSAELFSRREGLGEDQADPATIRRDHRCAGQALCHPGVDQGQRPVHPACVDLAQREALGGRSARGLGQRPPVASAPQRA
uniref:Phage_rep_O domain-containing protein n=1 Tax=Parastrongyloides trichosuri TaxID=131310 RepID=A0A0N4ZTV0_PARTI